MVGALEDAGFDGAEALRKRKTLQFMSSPGGHVGYDDWHRRVDSDMVAFIERHASTLNEEKLLKFIQQYDSVGEHAVRIPDVNLGF